MFERKYPNFIFSNLGQRFIAYIIDLILIYSVSSFIKSILVLFGIESQVVLEPIYTLIYLSYFCLMTKLTNGYSLGKAIMGLRVVSFEEDVLSWGTVITREVLGGYVLLKIKILFALALFTDYRQNLADLLADTSVLKESYLREIDLYFDNNEEDYEQLAMPLDNY